MVLLALVGRFNENTGNKCKVQVGGVGVNIQQLRMVGYSISLRGVTRADQEAIAWESHIVPDQLIVNVDILSSNQIHVGTPATFDTVGGNFTQKHPFTQGIPLATSSELKTTKFGLGDISFQINKRIHKDIEIEVLKYNDKGELVPMDVGTPAIVDTKYGTTTLQSIILYFQYDFISYF